MLARIQYKTLSKLQLLGYLTTLVVGCSLLFGIAQLYSDVQPIIEDKADVFGDEVSIVTKPVGAFGALSHSSSNLGFSSDEVNALASESFVSDVAMFRTASFAIHAFGSVHDGGPGFRSDLFFESVPDAYLDVESARWKWEEGDEFIPIVVPKNYIDLYNFGFAQSQQLPLLSEALIGQFKFDLELEGESGRQIFRGGIVGFSNKLNSILVPDEFLKWANIHIGSGEEVEPSRLMIAMKNPNDESLIAYAEANNYKVDSGQVEKGQLIYLYKSAIRFSVFIALVVLVLSVAFLYLSLNLMMEKHQHVIVNLDLLGYSKNQIAGFYQYTVIALTAIAVSLSTFLVWNLRKAVLADMDSMLNMKVEASHLLWYAVGVFVLLSLFFGAQIRWRVGKKV